MYLKVHDEILPSESRAVRASIAKSKIASSFWVSASRLLVSVTGGSLVLCSLQTCRVVVEAQFQLPASKQRWCTAAVLLSHSNENLPECNSAPPSTATSWSEDSLLLGDRSGSVHLFKKKSSTPLWTARSVHGSGGVTSICLLSTTARGALAVTTGRDGWLRYWLVSHSHVGNVGATRHSKATWLARVIPWQSDEILLSFKDVSFYIRS